MSDDNKLARKALRSSYISTVISISLVLFLIGSLGVLLLNAKYLSDYIRENVVLTILLKQDAAEQDIQNLKSQLEGNAYVSSVNYITREQAAEDLQKDLGEDFTTFLGFNPLLPVLEVKLKPEYAEESNLNQLKETVQQKGIVKESYFQEYHKMFSPTVRRKLKVYEVQDNVYSYNSLEELKEIYELLGEPHIPETYAKSNIDTLIDSLQHKHGLIYYWEDYDSEREYTYKYMKVIQGGYIKDEI